MTPRQRAEALMGTYDTEAIEGAEAFFNGVPATSNPYRNNPHPDDEDARGWSKGWHHAHDAQEQKND